MQQDEIIKKIGGRIAQIRLDKNLTQEELAADIEGWNRQHVSRIETGVNNPRMSSYIKICKALNIELNELFKDIKMLD